MDKLTPQTPPMRSGKGEAWVDPHVPTYSLSTPIRSSKQAPSPSPSLYSTPIAGSKKLLCTPSEITPTPSPSIYITPISSPIPKMKCPAAPSKTTYTPHAMTVRRDVSSSESDSFLSSQFVEMEECGSGKVVRHRTSGREYFVKFAKKYQLCSCERYIYVFLAKGKEIYSDLSKGKTWCIPLFVFTWSAKT